MAATYTNTLPTNKDWVRFLTGDTDTAAPLLQDEEINALLAEQITSGAAAKYLAAADALEALFATWSSKGKGIVEKQVSKLRIEYGVDSGAAEALRSRITYLRARGAWLLTPRPRMLKAVDTS